MMHDPFQTYAAFGQHYGVPSPIGLQYPQLQQQINPLQALAQMAQTGGIQQLGLSPYGSPYGQNLGQPFINPQQVQLAALVANNPLLLASVLSNPLVAASLQQGVQALGLQQQVSPYQQIGQQIGSPFGQTPFGQTGYPLAPQSWIGQAGQFGQQRPFQAQGFSPWGF
jgi:hypothetical protein